MSQPEFLYEVFEDFMDSLENKDFSFDNGLVCLWMTGQTKISPQISTYYAKPSKQEKLAETIHQNLLPLLTDCNKALQLLKKMFRTVENIIHLIEKDNMPKYLLFLEDIFPYMEKYH